jgi:hypothetical protein
VVFQPPDTVVIDWDAGTENHIYLARLSRRYSLDHHSGLPVVSGKTPVRMTGNHLELSISDDPSDSRIDPAVPRGTLRLILKRMP